MALENEKKTGMFKEIWNDIAERMGSLGRMLKVLFGDKEVPPGFQEKLKYVFGSGTESPEATVQAQPQSDPLPRPDLRIQGNDLAPIGVMKRVLSVTSGKTNRLADRLNNPGNLRAAKGAQPGGKGFVRFKTPEEGFRAMILDVEAKVRGNSKGSQSVLGHQPRTLYEVIRVYAPPHENDTRQYARVVAQALKVDIDEPVGNLATRIPEMAKVMAKHEGFTGEITLS